MVERRAGFVGRVVKGRMCRSGGLGALSVVGAEKEVAVVVVRGGVKGERRARDQMWVRISGGGWGRGGRF
jgi:hypothetical protein